MCVCVCLSAFIILSNPSGSLEVQSLEAVPVLHAHGKATLSPVLPSPPGQRLPLLKIGNLEIGNWHHPHG